MSGRGDTIDFSRYVALGDSIAAGYTDGALCYTGQLNSYPNLLAAQFKFAGGGDFRQPLVTVNSVGVGFNGNSCLVLKDGGNSSDPIASTLSFIESQGDLSLFMINDYQSKGPFNNMGIPGVKTADLLVHGLGNPDNGPGNYNPFFTRMASDTKKASALSDALLMKPTFFSLFIGNNDALAFALKGGTADSITPPYGPAGIGFEGSVSAILDELIATGAKGVISNIPDINSIPFFTAIPYGGLLLNSVSAERLNMKYNSDGIYFSPGKNTFVVYTPDNRVRKMEEGEMIILDIVLDPEHELLLTGQEPVPKKYILTKSELNKIKQTIESYNDILKKMALEKKLAFVDMNGLLKNSGQNIVYNPSIHNLKYKKKGVYSLDGLHPNAFGQSLLANEFIKSINKHYHVSVPLIGNFKYKRNVMPE